MGLISFIKGSDNRRHVKKLNALANKIEALADKYSTFAAMYISLDFVPLPEIMRGVRASSMRIESTSSIIA